MPSSRDVEIRSEIPNGGGLNTRFRGFARPESSPAVRGQASTRGGRGRGRGRGRGNPLPTEEPDVQASPTPARRSTRRRTPRGGAPVGTAPQLPNHVINEPPRTTQPRRRVRIETPLSSPGEEFHFTDSPSSEDNDNDFVVHETPTRTTLPTGSGPSSNTHPLPTDTPRQAQTPQRPRTPASTSRRTPGSARRTIFSRPAAIPRAAYHNSRAHAQRSRSGTKSRKRARDVWTFFEDINEKSCCHFCVKEMEAGNPVPEHEYSTTTGTDGRRQHLIKHHLKQWVESCLALKIPLDSAQASKDALLAYLNQFGTTPAGHSFASGDGARVPFSREALADGLMTLIVAEDLSLNLIESEYLRGLILMCREDIKDSDIPKLNSLRARVLESVDEYYEQLTAEMKESEGAISMTTDLWTDPRQRGYMAITAHWIEARTVRTAAGEVKELVMRSDLIAFYRLPGSHTGVHIAHAFVVALERLKIILKVGWITSDNAFNNDAFMRALADLLRERGIPADWDPDERRIRCFAHIVNLACQALMKHLEVMGYGLLERLRKLIRAIRSSNLRREHFAKCSLQAIHSELELILDSEIRWSSSYLMVERALLLRLALSRFFTCEDFQDIYRNNWISDDDWDLLQEMTAVLEVPHLFHQRLSSDKAPTLCDALPAFEALITCWTDQKNSHPLLVSAIDAGLDKLRGYLGQVRDIPAYTLAMAVNPMMKLGYFEAYRPREYSAAKKLLIETLKTYSVEADNDVANGDTSRPPPPRFTSLAEQILRGGGYGQVFDAATRSVAEEVDHYLREHSSATSSLVFWQERRLEYPTLYKLAMDILPIQGTSVPCERIFSSAKETITSRRTRLEPEMMEALQVLKFAIKAKRGLQFSSAPTKEEELQQLEEMTTDQFRVPYSIDAFVRDLRSYETFVVFE